MYQPDYRRTILEALGHEPLYLDGWRRRRLLSSILKFLQARYNLHSDVGKDEAAVSVIAASTGTSGLR